MQDLSVSDRYSDLLSRIEGTAKAAGRDPGSVTLVAVSKVQPDDRVAALLEAGHTTFGENRVQEAEGRWGERIADQHKALELRLIGPLQSNKAEAAVKLFDVIETLDRDKLAKALVNAAHKTGRLPRLMVQVNTGEEPQKSGVLPADLPDFLKRMKSEYDLIPEGLMCIPPQAEAPSPHFWWLAQMAEDHGLKHISMGMSGDFETAIKLGATHVRVGSALFGERDCG